MSDDFLTADIGDLLEEEEQEQLSEDERAYQALVEQDRKMIHGFTTHKERLRFPDPVTKRWRR